MDVLHGGGVNHVVDVLERPLKPLVIADIANEETDGAVLFLGVVLRHLVLLLFVARVDYQPLDARPALENILGKRFTQ